MVLCYLSVEQVTVSYSMYFHATKKKLRFSFFEEDQSNKSQLLIDLEIYTSCLRNTLILEESSTFYFISTQSRDCKRKPFLLATSITHFHPQKEHTLVLETARIARLQVQPFPRFFLFGHYLFCCIIFLCPMKKHNAYTLFWQC